MHLYLGDDFRVNESHQRANTDQYLVTRFWDNEPDQKGTISLNWENNWYFALDNGSREPIYQFSNERLLPGEFVDVRDHGDQMHIFKVISVELDNNSDSSAAVSEEAPDSPNYFDVHLNILPSDYESFLDTKYLLHLVLNNEGYVDSNAWAHRVSPWKVRSIGPNDYHRVGEIVYSSYAWYLVFKDSQTIYELIWQLENQCFFTKDPNALSIGIRDQSGHWHQYSVDNIKESGGKETTRVHSKETNY